MRYNLTLQAPLLLRASLLRNVACAGHYIILSTRPDPHSYPGQLLRYERASDNAYPV